MCDLNCAAGETGKDCVEQEQKAGGFEAHLQRSLNVLHAVLAARAKERAERDVFIKKSFASHNVINDALGKIKCCGDAKNGLFKMIVDGDELKCVCTSCYRISAFYIPFVLNGAFGDDVIRQG